MANILGSPFVANFANAAISVGSQQIFPIVNIVQGKDTTGSTSTSVTFTDTSSTASITPKFSTSKILVFVCGYAFTSVQSSTYTIARAGTNLLGSSGFTAVGTSLNEGISFMYYDSPATTSSVTYSVQYKTGAGGTAGYGGSTNTNIIILVEIAQ